MYFTIIIIIIIYTTIYTIYITATNDEGMSKNSESITEKTLKENGNKIINITLYNTMCCI